MMRLSASVSTRRERGVSSAVSLCHEGKQTDRVSSSACCHMPLSPLGTVGDVHVRVLARAFGRFVRGSSVLLIVSGLFRVTQSTLKV